MYLDDILMIPSHTAGMTLLKVDWHTPDWSASSFWKALVARNPRVVSTCVGTDNLWLLAVFHSRAGRSSAHNSSNTGLGNLMTHEPVAVICQQIFPFSKHPLTSDITISTVILLLMHLNVGMENDVCHIFVCTQH